MADHPIDILLRAKDQASKKIAGVNRELGILGRTSRGVKTATSNLLKLGAAGAAIGVGAGVLAIRSGLESLAERENVISATAAAIEATGNKANVSAVQIRAWSEAIETATGAAVDDKAVQAGANALLRFGAVQGDVFKRALTAATDLGAGMKTGPEAGAKLLGKALADPVKALGALRKAGIVLTKSEETRIKALVKANKVQEAQGVILTAVEKRYKGAAAASAGPYTRALNMMSDASEDAKMALAEGFLPVIERVANRLQTKMADPATIANLRNMGDNIAGVFDKALDFAEGIDWNGLGQGLKVAADWAGKLFGAFMSLPPEVKGTIIALAGLDKLSGGAVSGIASELGKGLIKGVLGINAAVVNVNGAKVNGGGGAGDLPGKNGGGGIGSFLKSLPIFGATLANMDSMKPDSAFGTFTKDRFERTDYVKGVNTLKSTTTSETSRQIGRIDRVAQVGEGTTRATAMGAMVTAGAARIAGVQAAMASFNSASRIVSAVQAAGKPTVNVYVSVPGASVRYGSGPSRGRVRGGEW